MRRPSQAPVRGILLIWLIAALVLPAFGWAAKRTVGKTPENRMSSMGQLASKIRAAIHASGGRSITLKTGDGCDNAPDCGDDEDGPAGGQAEVSIAVDSTGQHIVIGFNDTRGFSHNPVSVSGVMYSDDGGVTFVDGGQLPSPGTDLIGSTRLPQVLGDPDVRSLGGCNFVYSSILVKKFSATTAAQTMGVHRSTDCGHTWAGPFEVTPVTNPHGLVTGSGAPRDSADKEFIDADPETGRVLLTWSNFTPVSAGGVEISATYSDNIMTATPPTWSTRAIVAAGPSDGQSSQPRFARGSSNAYVVWRQFPFPGTFFGNGNTIGFSRSTDNGATWSAPVALSSEFFTMDQVLGNDRVNTSPSIAVDNSVPDDVHKGHAGSSTGNVYVVYANNNNHDGADVVFQKSTDGGLTFSAPVALNSRPGNDRAQWFPWVTVDSSTGRVWVFYYDQGIATSGDRTETTVTWSDDAGAHWSPPVPLTDRPFQAGWGNDTGQPNLGDYNEAVAQNGELFASFAVASRPLLGFVDGQPGSASLNTPDVAFRRVPEGDDDSSPAGRAIDTIPVHIVSVTTADSGGNGFIDPGETVKVTFNLNNYDTNPLSSRKVNGTTARLSTTTPGVTVTQDQSPFSNMNPGDSSSNKKDFVLSVSPSFVAGTPIELMLTVRSNEHGAATLLSTLFTGTPVATTLLAENFDSVAPGTLPAGWTTAHGGGSNVVPWTTSASFATSLCGTSNGAFHRNANDGTPANTRFERLFSPVFNVPATSGYVTVDFDVCYDTEDDPSFNILAYDGLLLRVTDLTPGHVLRSVQVEAFQDQFTTGSSEGFVKHFPRSSNSAYFQDMSSWAGFSNGVKHVHLRLPGMAGTTAQLRFEYTQDSFGICSDVRPGHSCGVLVDNIVVKNVTP
ncbi:MAG TPA: hypothetical protein VH988_32155 [Thermoanaerobaculia bacterium]|jgi:hypothetical protein|nr:hypothetical protein [Thermoanaerobaculia bacterium]